MARKTRQGQPRPRRGRVSRRSWWSGSRLWTLGVSVVVVALIAVVIAVSIGGSSDLEGADFEISVYQGEDVVGGSTLNFSDLFLQGKPVVLNFWAGQCPPCRAEMPGFQAVYEQHKDDFILFGVDIGPFTGLGSRQDGRNLLQELNITYPAGTTFDAGVPRAYNVIGMPTTVFFTADGKVFRRFPGALDPQRMNANVEALIEASQGST